MLSERVIEHNHRMTIVPVAKKIVLVFKQQCESGVCCGSVVIELVG